MQCRRFYCSRGSVSQLIVPPAVDRHDLSLLYMRPTPASFENLGRGAGGDEQGRLLAQLGSEDCQALLSQGHDCHGFHLPTPTGGLLEVDLQDVL